MVDINIDVPLPSIPAPSGPAPPNAPTPSRPSPPPPGGGGQSRSPSPGSRTPDPVGELSFRMQIEGITLGYFTEVTGLSVEYEVFEWQEGGQNTYVHKLRGRAKYPNIVLKRGITHESALLDWFRECQTKTARKQGYIELLGPNGKAVRRWAFDGAFPVKWTGPNLNASSSNIATETLEFVHTGFRPERVG